jgi:hypothetical protein
MVERLRWRIACGLNRLPGSCWADLVSWALDGSKAARRVGDSVLPWRPITDLCHRDAAENGGHCYCSKIRAHQAE